MPVQSDRAEQTWASSAPIVWQLFKGVFRRNPPARVRAEAWDIKKAIDLFQSWCKPAALKNARLTLKTAVVLVLATGKRCLDQNLLRIIPKNVQVTANWATFQPVFVTRNVPPNHKYGPTIALRRSEDDCLCLVLLVKECLARTIDTEQRSEKFIVTRK